MSAKLREMLDKRNTMITQARAIVDKAEKEKRELNAEEKVNYDNAMKDALDLREKIDRETRLIEAEKEMAGTALQTQQERQIAAPEAEQRAKAFRSLLVHGNLTADEQRALMEQRTTLTAGNDIQAGYLLAPQEFVKNLIVAVKNLVFVEGLATGFQTTNANGLGFPSLDTDADDFEMVTEIQTAVAETGLKFGKRELKPHFARKVVRISDKLLRSDGMNVEAIVMDRLAYKQGVTKEKKYLTGTGNQEPLGLFTASALGITTSRDYSTDMATDNFTADALKGVKYSLKAQYMAKANWLFHRDGVAKIAKLKDGMGRYIFEAAEAIGALDTLLGRPLKMSEYAPNTFTASQYVGMFGDFSWYYIANSLAYRVKRLNEYYAATGEIGFIVEFEFDGMPVLAEAFTRIETAAS
jgi:HK97 family phage major capsid protein